MNIDKNSPVPLYYQLKEILKKDMLSNYKQGDKYLSQNEIKKQNEVCIVTKNGYGVAAILPIEKYNYLLSNLEDHLDEQDETLVHNVEKSRHEYRSGKFHYLEDIIAPVKNSFNKIECLK